jgi:hypothetical protein
MATSNKFKDTKIRSNSDILIITDNDVDIASDSIEKRYYCCKFNGSEGSLF